eukprot:395531-Prorocentrum_minimum.AAC.3
MVGRIENGQATRSEEPRIFTLSGECAVKQRGAVRTGFLTCRLRAQVNSLGKLVYELVFHTSYGSQGVHASLWCALAGLPLLCSIETCTALRGLIRSSPPL